MSDLMTYLRLVVTGTSSEAVTAIEEVDAATFKLGEAQKKANAEQTVMAKSGHNGLLLMAGGAGLVTAAVLGTVDAYAKQAEAAIQVEKLTGMNAKQASDFVVQSQAMGISADSLGTILGRMSKNVVGYMDGSTSATSAMGKAFEMAGISVDSLKGMNAGQVIDDIREKIAAMPAGLERSDVIQSIFGKGAAGNPDLLRFLTATQSQLDSINKTASQFGLVFSQHDLDNATKYGEEMRMLKLEFEGIAVSIGKELAPDLAAGGKAVGDLLRLFNAVPNSIKPILMLTPGFLMMGVGIYKVEQATVGLSKAGYSAIQMVRAFVSAHRQNVVATDADTTATEGETVATEGETTALKAGVIELGLYAIAIGAAMVAIYEIVKAYEKWKDAANQAAQAAANAQSTLNAAPNAAFQTNNPSMQSNQSRAQIQSEENRDAYHAPSTAGWIGGALAGYATKQVEPWKWFGGGGSFEVNRPTIIGVGEKGTERVDVTPGDVSTDVSRSAGGSRAALPAAGGSGVTVVIQMAGANFIGEPTSAHAERWAKALEGPLAQRLGESLYDTLHGARH